MYPILLKYNNRTFLSNNRKKIHNKTLIIIISNKVIKPNFHNNNRSNKYNKYNNK